MVKGMYSSYDNVSGVYGIPMLDLNNATAIRNFIVGVKDANVCYVKDLALYKVGEFDDSTGELIPCKPEFLINGTSALVDGKELDEL